MEYSTSIAEISKAVAAAQAEVENAAKLSSNPAFRSKYADLATILNEVRPIFSKNGLALTQHPTMIDNHIVVETLLSHTSGEWIRSAIHMPIGSKGDAHAVGSAITYARRYSLAAICGISQEDDDGNAAAKAKADHKDEEKVQLDPKILKEIEISFSIEGLTEIWQSIPKELQTSYKDAFSKAKERILAP